jgi:RNA polymerase sigma-54 factor
VGPGHEQSLRQTVRQEMAMLPRMLQSIEILQLPGTELETFLMKQAEENGALRLEGGGGLLHGTYSPEASERKNAWLERQEAPGRGLLEALQEQLSWLDVSTEDAPWVRLVVECLDDRGYLSLSDEALQEHAEERGLEGGLTRLGRAIALVQQKLEPRGIGGRSLVEALLLQLDPKEEDYELLCRLLEEFLDDLARNKLPAVARSLGVSMERLDALMRRLRQLHPAPAAGMGGAAPPPITPEVIVERSEEGFRVRIDNSGLPTVSIDPDFRALAKTKGAHGAKPDEVQRYMRNKLDRARWIVEALEQRKRTLQRVATHVFGRQQRFLDNGPGALVPLSMGEVADALSIHPSTVSRAVAGKYTETPYGVFPLRDFFPVAAAGSVAGAVRDDAREAVRAIVAGEDPGQPFSDDVIVKAMGERGFKVARRTVAKYRKELSIPSSYRRRRYAS